MTSSSILALDVGSKRIGLATAVVGVKIAYPLFTINNSDDVHGKLRAIVSEHGVSRLVVGYPRGLDGQSTEQTEYVEQFARDLQSRIDLPVQFQDEALTSVKAERELAARGKPYEKGEVDSLAATYILEDYLLDQQNRGDAYE